MHIQASGFGSKNIYLGADDLFSPQLSTPMSGFLFETGAQ